MVCEGGGGDGLCDADYDDDAGYVYGWPDHFWWKFKFRFQKKKIKMIHDSLWCRRPLKGLVRL